MQVPVAWTVAADARGEVQSSAGLAGQADGVLHGAVSQPARIAPVQPLTPGLEELVEGGEDSTLLLALSLGFMEVEPVLPAGRLVGEHDAWGQTGHSAGSAGSPLPRLWPRQEPQGPQPIPNSGSGTGTTPAWHSPRLRHAGWGCSGHAAASGELPATSGGTGTQALVLGTHGPPSWGQHRHTWGCTDYGNGDAGTTTTGSYGPRSRGHTDRGPRETWTWGWRDHHHEEG